MSIRSLTRYADVQDDSRIRAYRNGRADLVWYQTDTVQLDLYITNGGRPVAIASGATVKMEAWTGSDTGTLNINVTGTVVNAAAGHVRVQLNQVQSNLTAGSYNYVVKVAGDGVALYGVATVIASPNSDEVEDAASSYAQRIADVDWTNVGNVDVELSSTKFLVTNLIFYTDAANTGVVWTAGPDTDPDGIIPAGAAFAAVEHYQTDSIITSGTLRVAITSAGAAGQNGKVIVKGIDLS